MTELTLSIYDPNTLLPHRAGIAGLALALSSMSTDNAPLTWDITEDEVKLAWQCTDKEAVQWLIEHTYQIQDGYLNVPALKLDRQGLYSFTEGLTSTFLQHSKQRKRDSNARSLSFQIDEGQPEIRVDFRPLLECYYTGDLKDAFTTKGAFKPEISLKGHHLPGLVECFANGAYQESPSNFLALLFTPLACHYHKLPAARSALVIPEVQNLLRWIDRKQELSGRTYRNFRSSSAGESGLQFLWHQTLMDDAQKGGVKYCEVYQLGKQTWDGNQSYLKQAVYRVKVRSDTLKIYDSATQFFPHKVKQKEGSEPFLAFSKALPWICDNLIAYRYWYAGSHEFLKRNGLYERKGLIDMTTEYLNEQEQIFFDAVQGSFNVYLAKQLKFRKDQLKRELTKEEARDEFFKNSKKVIHRLQHPSTQKEFAKALVKFLSDFPSKPGRGAGDQIYLWLHKGTNWQQTKDLTLLAIATYKSKKGDALDEQNISTDSIPETEPEEIENEDI
jgi:CRISPR-associated protein Cas8a1/Csx13